MTQKACACKGSDTVYCIINPATNRLHRVTFSLSLSKHIIKYHHPEYEIRQAAFIRGKRLASGESSPALYGIVSTKKDIVLRVPMTKESAEMYADDDSRHIEEIYLQL